MPAVTRHFAARVLDNEPIPITRRLVTGRLCALLKIVTRSAGLAFKRTSGFSGPDACLLAKIGEHGRLTPAELVALLGYDKGQVSRAVTRLANERVLARDVPRGPVSMTRTGRAAYTRILRLARSRNSQLLRELTEQQALLLPVLMGKLETNARGLLAMEIARQRTREGTVQPLSPGAPARARPSFAQLRHKLVVPELISLRNLVLKSAALAVERELSLSEVDWQLISHIGEHSPLTQIELMSQMSQERSQVARALLRTEGVGLITREKIGGGRHVLISITDRGRKTYDRIMQLALQRNAVLVRGIAAPEQHEFSAILDKLMVSADVLLVREQSLAD
jgi:DNA-binding MarR family transcriptional regulator